MIQDLERVMWRLRKMKRTDMPYLSNIQLRKAIIKEIGSDIRTYNNNKTALVLLGWIKTWKKGKHIEITDLDLKET